MYKILVDSCGELSEEMRAGGHFVNIPLILRVDNEEIVDDENFDQKTFLAKVASSSNEPKSACPSPDAYMKWMEGESDHIYIVTLSSKLSGSYASASLGKELYEEEYGDAKKIHVFDSRSASIGESLIGLKIEELEEEGLPFEEVVSQTQDYIEKQHTFFVLETLETLRKSGRLSGLAATIIKALNIKPVMGSTEVGSIQKLGQERGMTRALMKMVRCLMEVTPDPQNRVLAIAHCNCPERAQMVKAQVEKLAHFKKILILDTAGVSSMYANDGGIIMAG